MNKHQAFQLIALNSAKKPDYESNTRYVLRWYSKTFHTPLHIVYDLPLDEIWLTYYEERYQEMTEEDLEAEIERVLETPDARNEREMAEELKKSEELTFMKMAEQSRKDHKNLKSSLDKALETVKNLETSVSLPEAPVIEESIEMSFISDSEMEKLLNGDMAETPKKEVDPLSFK